MDGDAQFLQETSTKLLKWSSDNLMKSNAGNCHLSVSTKNTVNIRVENFDTKNSRCKKLWGVKFDHKLTFNNHISDLYEKASKKN